MATLFLFAFALVVTTKSSSSDAWSPSSSAVFSASRRSIVAKGRSYPSDTSKDIILLHASSTSDGEISDTSRPETDLKRLVSEIGKKSEQQQTSSNNKESSSSRPRYQLGVGKNQPLGLQPDEKSTTFSIGDQNIEDTMQYISLVEPVSKPVAAVVKTKPKYDTGVGRNAPLNNNSANSNRGSYDTPPSQDSSFRTTKTHLLTQGDEFSARLTRAVWDKDHFDESGQQLATTTTTNMNEEHKITSDEDGVERTNAVISYEQIDLSVPPSVYSLQSGNGVSPEATDLVWDLMRHEAKVEAAREPLLVSFLYSTILNHPTLESALAFHLANRLSNPAMLSTQIMALIREALDADPDFRRNLRADILAVRDRDPACTCLPDVFLYFKGFHALQTYRVSHYLWKSGRRVLAHYLQSQVSQHFQIDIHPNATLGSGIMLDHGTGIVIGETAHLGHNCSVLHHVTLGGSGKKGNDRHPKVGNGVLLGAGASVLGNINIGDGCQVGAGTLVIEDLPPRSVAVGVPAKIIGRFVDVTAQPSIGMHQLGSKESDEEIAFNI